MGQQWMELQAWAFRLQYFRDSLHLGGEGEEGRDNAPVFVVTHEGRDPWERLGGTT